MLSDLIYLPGSNDFSFLYQSLYSLLTDKRQKQNQSRINTLLSLQEMGYIRTGTIKVQLKLLEVFPEFLEGSKQAR